MVATSNGCWQRLLHLKLNILHEEWLQTSTSSTDQMPFSKKKFFCGGTTGSHIVVDNISFQMILYTKLSNFCTICYWFLKSGTLFLYGSIHDWIQSILLHTITLTMTRIFLTSHHYENINARGLKIIVQKYKMQQSMQAI